jgi:hypothetical protein
LKAVNWTTAIFQCLALCGVCFSLFMATCGRDCDHLHAFICKIEEAMPTFGSSESVSTAGCRVYGSKGIHFELRCSFAHANGTLQDVFKPFSVFYRQNCKSYICFWWFWCRVARGLKAVNWTTAIFQCLTLCGVCFSLFMATCGRDCDHLHAFICKIEEAMPTFGSSESVSTAGCRVYGSKGIHFEQSSNALHSVAFVSACSWLLVGEIVTVLEAVPTKLRKLCRFLGQSSPCRQQVVGSMAAKASALSLGAHFGRVNGT